jgi:hypothetical protein
MADAQPAPFGRGRTQTRVSLHLPDRAVDPTTPPPTGGRGAQTRSLRP